MNEPLKFDRNRKKAKYCPCGKSNRNQKFAPFQGYLEYGFCFSCEETFLPKNGTVSKVLFPKEQSDNKNQTSYHDPSLLNESFKGYSSNKFVQFLRRNFTENEIHNTIKKYRIGSSKHWKGATVFWQIDNHNKVRHGKIMLYDATTGKRVKSNDGRAFISSVRSVLKLQDHVLEQCLFGLHLVNETHNTNIALVEGEKTAILMSLFKPEYIWMATGSKQGFKLKNLKPIKKYDIVLFPDKGEYDGWQQKAEQFNSVGFKIIADDWLELQPEYPKGSDLADVYLGALKKTNESRLPQPFIIKTIADVKVAHLSKINPAIWELIDSFDLVDENGYELKRAQQQNSATK